MKSSLKVVVVGSGYVGLISGVCHAKNGHEVVFVDHDPEKVEMINAGTPPIFEHGLADTLAKLRFQGRISATTKISEALRGADISLICVGTPSISDGTIDLSYVKQAASDIGWNLKHCSPYHVVVVRSTVVPTTTMTVVAPAIEEASGVCLGQFGLVMCPEFLREGSAMADADNPDRIVIGTLQDEAFKLCASLFESYDVPIIHTTPENAELIKYASNSLLATLISFSNEIATICETLPGSDAHEVMKGVHLDRRFSKDLPNGLPEVVKYLEGGIGYGGSCFPKDVKAIQGYVTAHKIESSIFRATIDINEQRICSIVDLIERDTGSVRGKSVALLGLAFKPDTDDIRESPALKLLEALKDKGAIVRGFDPIAAENIKKSYGNEITVLADIPDVMRGADIAIITQANPEFKKLDWNALTSLMKDPYIFDGRRVIEFDRKVHSFKYAAVGRLTDSCSVAS